MRRTAALALLTAGASLGCRMFTSHHEYRSYRAYRYEAQGPARLAAGSRYLSENPRGRYVAQVQREVYGAEEDFWADHRASVEGLNEYLASFPSGAHVGEARERLAAFEARRRQDEATRRENEAAERARREQELADAAARARVWGRTSYDRWVRLFGGLQGWGQGVGAIVQANPNFGAAFENAPPQCRGAHCRKDYVQDFMIPIPGRTAVPRRLTLQLDMVRVGQERAVNQVFINLRNRGLATWQELETQTANDPNDTEAREAGRRWAMDQLKAIVLAAFPNARETPANLYGPPPEPVVQGAEEDDDDATPPPTDPNACVVPSQPLGARWSAVVGCELPNAPQLTVSAEVAQAHAQAMGGNAGEAVTPHACLRIDAYASLDAEGMGTDEGLLISQIPACALTAAARPGRRPPARPAARPAPARPAPAR